jgi:predicted adenylyl cyclase CyaB
LEDRLKLIVLTECLSTDIASIVPQLGFWFKNDAQAILSEKIGEVKQMPFEVELKARLQCPEDVKFRAAELGERVGETFKEDVYFRRQGDSSRYPSDRYRLRREEGKAVVTFKQQAQAGDTEVYDEVEFAVSNAHAFFRFADRFGFEPFVVKRKKSEVYRVGRAHVELNEVEHAGHFTEIEILCDDEAEVPSARIEIAHVLAQLGLTQNDLEPTPYILMIQDAHPVQFRFVNDPALDWPFEEISV